MHKALDLYIVLDRSGSMTPLADTVVSEVNRLVAAVADDHTHSTVTLVAFDSNDPFDVVLDRCRNDGRPALDADDYRPGGGTPLFDAVAATLQMASRNQRSDRHDRHVKVAIVTDGADNDSEHTAVDVLGKIRRRKAAGWDFLYLGVGPVWRDAARIGLDPDEVHPWAATREGARAAFATLTAASLHRAVRSARPRRARRPHHN
jgi:hypothetical protein